MDREKDGVFVKSLDQIKLSSLMRATSGRPEVVVGVIDGLVDLSHPAFQGARIRSTHRDRVVSCRNADSVACSHGTFIAGILGARRGLPAPAICPQCDLVLRPIFHEEQRNASGMPASSPRELATAIRETIDAGARVINLSVGLSQAPLVVYRELHEVCHYAVQRGVILVVASGNQGRIGYNPLLVHPWVIPVTGCDERGSLSRESNLAPSVGKRGLMAPGRNITSTSPGGQYVQISGTSVAVPFVTGTIALLWSEFPQATAAEIRHAVLRGATARRGTITPPLLNAEAAWKLLRSKTVRPTPVPSNKEITMASNQSDQQAQTPPPPSPTPAVVSPAQDEGQPPGLPAPLVENGDSPAIPPHPQRPVGGQPPADDTGFAEEPEEPSFIYALGTIEARFPTLAVEKEFAQAAKAGETVNLTDVEVVYAILKENRYLAREVCWVLMIEGIEVYILVPRDPHVLDQLVEAVKPAERGVDCDVVIGTRGPLASPEMCNGLVVPMVLADQIYSFDVPSLIKAIPKPKGVEEKPFRAAADELFYRIQQLADNVGEMDEHRALNYLAVRYPRVYDLIAEKHAEDCSLSGVEVRPSRLSGVRKLLDVVLSFTSRKTDVEEKHYVRVDVTEKYPFLASKLAPFYDRV